MYFWRTFTIFSSPPLPNAGVDILFGCSLVFCYHDLHFLIQERSFFRSFDALTDTMLTWHQQSGYNIVVTAKVAKLAWSAKWCTFSTITHIVFWYYLNQTYRLGIRTNFRPKIVVANKLKIRRERSQNSTKNILLVGPFR